MPLGLGAKDVLLESRVADHVLGRLDAHTHLVAVVVTFDRDAMQAGPDLPAQHGARFGDCPKLFAAVIHSSILSCGVHCEKTLDTASDDGVRFHPGTQPRKVNREAST